MRRFALPLLPAMLAFAAPAMAQDVEAWTPTGTVLRANAAGIALPQTIAGLSLSKSGELSNGGKGVDNYAQYLSDDGAIQATLYVYMPSYADAALAAYMTDKAVMERFGTRTRRTAYAGAAAGGRQGTAIRAIYDDAADGALTTGAAFIHAGRWMVKLRVTGPSERRKEVLAGLDSMLAGLRFDDPQSLHAAAPAEFAPCPVADGTDARLTSAAPVTETAALSVPHDGAGRLCVRGAVETAEGRYDMLQQADVQGGAILVPVDDAGTLLAVDPAGKDGYRLSIHSVGQTDLYGLYDKVPSARQIAAILEGKDPQTAQAGTIADHAANGTVTLRTASAKAR